MKSTFSVAEINEETTSFISYEEKHEKEDNSEHLTSNHSSVNSKDLPKYDGVEDDNEHGIENEAFVQDPHDNAQIERINEIDNKSKSKKKDKKSKAVKKTKEKRKKRHAEQTTDQIEVIESEDDIQNTYDFKKVIGINKL